MRDRDETRLIERRRLLCDVIPWGAVLWKKRMRLIKELLRRDLAWKEEEELRQSEGGGKLIQLDFFPFSSTKKACLFVLFCLFVWLVVWFGLLEGRSISGIECNNVRSSEWIWCIYYWHDGLVLYDCFWFAFFSVFVLGRGKQLRNGGMNIIMNWLDLIWFRRCCCCCWCFVWKILNERGG